MSPETSAPLETSSVPAEHERSAQAENSAPQETSEESVHSAPKLTPSAPKLSVPSLNTVPKLSAPKLTEAKHCIACGQRSEGNAFCATCIAIFIDTELECSHCSSRPHYAVRHEVYMVIHRVKGLGVLCRTCYAQGVIRYTWPCCVRCRTSNNPVDARHQDWVAGWLCERCYLRK